MGADKYCIKKFSENAPKILGYKDTHSFETIKNINELIPSPIN